VTALAVRYLTLADVEDEGLRRALAGESVASIAGDFASRVLHPDAVASLVQHGIVARIHDRLGDGRHPVEAVETLGESDSLGGRLHPLRHFARDHWQRVLAANYEGADGVRRALIDFSPADVQHVRTWAEARAAGLRRLGAAMTCAGDLLVRHDKGRIGDLPEPAQREIAEALT